MKNSWPRAGVFNCLTLEPRGLCSLSALPPALGCKATSSPSPLRARVPGTHVCQLCAQLCKQGSSVGYSHYINVISILGFLFFFFFFRLLSFLRATPAVYGGSQARDLIGLHHGHGHSHTGSELHLRPAPQLTPMPDPSPTERGQGSNPHPHGY